MGRPLDDVFETISERPIAAASLGQARDPACAPLVHQIHALVGGGSSQADGGHKAEASDCTVGAVPLMRPWNAPQVYKAKLRSTGEAVAVKVQRPNIEPVIFRDLWLLRAASFVINAVAIQRLGCYATLIIDEFGEKLLEARCYSDFPHRFRSPPLAAFYVLRMRRQR